MAFCTNCGATLEEGKKFCTSCGTPVQAASAQAAPAGVDSAPIEVNPVSVESGPAPAQAAPVFEQPAYGVPPAQSPQDSFGQPGNGYQQPQPASFAPSGQPASQPVDSGSIGWAILGFFIPIVGIILFFVWQKQKPQSAKMAIIGAAVSIILALFMRVFVH